MPRITKLSSQLHSISDGQKCVQCVQAKVQSVFKKTGTEINKLDDLQDQAKVRIPYITILLLLTMLKPLPVLIVGLNRRMLGECITRPLLAS